MATTWTEETISTDSMWTSEKRRFQSIYGVARYGVSIYADASAGASWTDEVVSTSSVWSNELKS
jgi:hypothetical protein